MAFDANAWLALDGNHFDGTWRDLEVGVNPEIVDHEQANGANDGPGIPREPIYTRLEGPWGLPWYDAVEDPYKRADFIPISPNPNVWSPYEDDNRLARLADYEGAFKSRGGVQAWGHEPSGGLSGDQALGLIMRFPANIPERYDPNGVFNTDIRDDLAAGMYNDTLPYQSDTAVTTGLLQWPDGLGEY